MKNLVIVESPTKAKTITKFLNKSYQVVSSYGHVRDLPKNKMGIDIENNFEPHYVIPVRVKKTVKELKKKASSADKIILATDEDREGEAIAWHLITALGLDKNNKGKKSKEIERITFHEITKEAIAKALENPRLIDQKLVNAQQARRILDRLVGYELSPFLWRKITKKLSAGRVQSVAVRLIVEREEEINKFKSEEYWSLEAIFTLPMADDDKSNGMPGQKFLAKLDKINGKKIDKLEIKNEIQAQAILQNLEKASYRVTSANKKEVRRKASPPFITSTLQQEANRRFGFSAKQTMRLAQQLYEGINLEKEGPVGLITYMRTDSFNLSENFLSESADYLSKNFASSYYKEKKFYKNKSKSAQEAHEAIRPTSVFREPEKIEKYLDKNQFKLYKLIWQRAVASQMTDAILDQTAVEIIAANTPYIFLANGQIIKFDGFLKIYHTSTSETILPLLKENDELSLIELKKEQHFTQPPARYSEAGLIKKLEAYGIGRPSTYAPTISTIQDRGYIVKEAGRLKPMEIAFLVNKLLTEHFSKIVDYKFTAKMEDDLDRIAQGKAFWQPVINEFYQPFKKNLLEKEKLLSKEEILGETTSEKCPDCGSNLVVRMSRFGKFLACSDFPKCKYTKNLENNNDEKNGKEKRGDEETENKQIICDKCGAPMQIKFGPYGKFFGCSNYPECKNIKSLNASLDIKCPKCEKGEIIEKKTKRKKTFYACNRWPDCKFALWQKPVANTDKSIKKCPLCSAPLVYNKDGIVCSNKDCHHKE